MFMFNTVRDSSKEKMQDLERLQVNSTNNVNKDNIMKTENNPFIDSFNQYKETTCFYSKDDNKEICRLSVTTNELSSRMDLISSGNIYHSQAEMEQLQSGWYEKKEIVRLSYSIPSLSREQYLQKYYSSIFNPCDPNRNQTKVHPSEPYLLDNYEFPEFDLVLSTRDLHPYESWLRENRVVLKTNKPQSPKPLSEAMQEVPSDEIPDSHMSERESMEEQAKPVVSNMERLERETKEVEPLQTTSGQKDSISIKIQTAERNSTLQSENDHGMEQSELGEETQIEETEAKSSTFETPQQAEMNQSQHPEMQLENERKQEGVKSSTDLTFQKTEEFSKAEDFPPKPAEVRSNHEDAGASLKEEKLEPSQVSIPETQEKSLPTEKNLLPTANETPFKEMNLSQSSQDNLKVDSMVTPVQPPKRSASPPPEPVKKQALPYTFNIAEIHDQTNEMAFAALRNYLAIPVTSPIHLPLVPFPQEPMNIHVPQLTNKVVRPHVFFNFSKKELPAL